MTDLKISQLNALTGASTAADDEFVIVDTSGAETMRITRAELANALGDNFATLAASTSLTIASSTTVDGILDEDNMASDSASKLATQQSIKAYVDAQITSNNELSEVLANGNSTGGTNIVVTAGDSITVDTISETTAAAGVTIDGVLLKDGEVTGDVTGNITSTGASTFSNIDINGGTIDGITDLAIADGGTGASDAATARTNLGVNITNVSGQANTATDFIDLPAGSDAQRGSPSAGSIRFSTTSTSFEGYDGSSWGAIGGGGGTIDLTTDVTGILPIANGGTNATSASAAATNLGLGTGDSPSFAGLTVDTSTLHVDSTNNRIGVGTASPATKLHLGGSSNQTIRIEGASNTAYLGTNANRGDLFVNYDPTNGTIPNSNRSTAGIQLDGADGGSNIVFRTANANNAASSERVRITADGSVGIGTDSPTGSGKILHVNSSTTVADLHITNSFSGATASDGFVLRYSGASAEFLNREAGSLIFYTSGTSRMTIDDAGRFYVPNVYASTTGGGANVNVSSSGRLERSTSSLRYKNTINDATHGLSELLTLRPVTYKGNNDGDTVFGGLIAEEVHDAGLTEFVQYDEQDRPDALSYGNMVSLCIKAIQELNAKVEALETANADMLARIEALEAV